MLDKFIKTICIAFLSIGFFACSESSSSAPDEEEISSGLESSDSDFPESSSDSKSSSSTKYSSTTHIDISEINIDEGFYLDENTGIKYKTVTVGPFVWLAENISVKPKVINSTCYGNDEKSCEKYGRLYRPLDAGELCPGNFRLPLKSEWEYLVRNGRIFDEKLGITLGGFCNTSDSSGCIGTDSVGAFITAKNKAYHISKDSSYATEQDNMAYYSLRCMKYAHVVAKFEDLPECDDEARTLVDSFYVWSIKDDLHCGEYGWRPVYSSSIFADHCDDAGALFKSDTAIFVCRSKRFYKSETWTYAAPVDLYDCDDSMRDSVMTIGPITQVCEEDGWRSLEEIEKVHGFCKKPSQYRTEMFQNLPYTCDENGWNLSLQTILSSSSINIYSSSSNPANCTKELSVKVDGNTAMRCEAGSWVAISDTVYLGVCNQANMNKVTAIGTKSYQCRTYGWQQLSSIEQSIGACTDTTIGKIKTYRDTSYLCRIEVPSSQSQNVQFSWGKITNDVASLGACTADLVGTIKKTASGISYKCTSNSWVAASVSDVYGNCSSTKTKLSGVFNGVEYICDIDRGSYQWYAMQPIDSVAGYCAKPRANLLISYKDVYYICSGTPDPNVWKEATREEILKKCTTALEGAIYSDSMVTAKCTASSWKAVLTETLKDPRDGNVYYTTTFDGKTWMAENLRYKGAGVDRFWYPNDNIKYESRGLLYQWHTAMQLDSIYDKTILGYDQIKPQWQGLCPAGWHIPDEDELSSLRRAVNNSKIPVYAIGLKVAGTGFRYQWYRNGIDVVTGFEQIDTTGYFWGASFANSKTTIISNVVDYDNFSTTTPEMNMLNSKVFAHGVRCVKDY